MRLRIFRCFLSRARAGLGGRLAICTGVICCLFAAGLAGIMSEHAYGADDTGQPRLVLQHKQHNFGTVAQGTPVAHSFPISNAGSAPLKILKINADCGCTAAAADSDTIEPGGQTELKVNFDTTGFKGAKVKTVRIYTNDPQQSSALLMLEGVVKPDVVLQPAVIDFGSVGSGVEHKRDMFAYVEDGSATRLLDVRTHAEDLEAVLEDAAYQGKPAKKIVVTLKPSAPIGPLRARVALRTTSPKEPIVNIPVAAQVEGMLRLEPSAVVFGTVPVPMEKAVEKTVRLINTGEGKIRIVAVQSDNPAVTVRHSELEEGKAYELKIALKSDSPAVIRSRVRITTDHPDKLQKALTLPVYAILPGNKN